MNTEENIARSLELQRRTKDAGFAFLMTDLDAAMTFAQSALQSPDHSDKKIRNQANARRGYDAIAHLTQRIAPFFTEVEKQELEQKLAKLREVLEQLGEKL